MGLTTTIVDAPACLNSMNIAGWYHGDPTDQRQVTFAAERSDCTAKCSATNDDEHAV